MFRIIIFIFAILMSVIPANAKHKHLEKDYQCVWCESIKGQTEYLLPDKTRIDCLTDTFAVEADFASKWAEAIGQALYYASQTNRTPGILLILEKESDIKYINRILESIEYFNLPIKIWTITPKQYEEQIK